jgi:two-component system sensor histidine kinase KdpD
MPTPRSPIVPPRTRPSWALGVATTLAGVAVATLAVTGLRHQAPVISLSVVYLIPILALSAYWGIALGAATSVLSALSFNFFFLEPTGRLTVADSRNWVGLLAFLVVALVTSTMAEATRARAAEADERRREADLGAELARTLLGAPRLSESLALVSRRLAELLDARSAAVELGAVPDDDERRIVVPLRDGERATIGSLVLPADLPAAQQTRVRERVVPVLESVLAAALARERLQADVVETAALRRSDEIKTAVLRSVSHDLRTPVTAMLAGIGALRSASVTAQEREEVEADIADAATRLSTLIDKLLDLSRLQAGTASPQLAWSSVDEALREAAAHAGGDVFRFSIDPALPLVRADAAQLERAFANLMENAARYGGGQPVSVRARAVGDRVLVRIVDRGPGIPLREQERVFTPFYRGEATARTVPGSGLGLAIARGFIEANGGTVTVESLPGQGTTFVIALPVELVPA